MPMTHFSIFQIQIHVIAGIKRSACTTSTTRVSTIVLDISLRWFGREAQSWVLDLLEDRGRIHRTNFTTVCL